MSSTQVIFRLGALTKIEGCVVSGICFVYVISQKITAVFFSFQVVTWSEACGPALVRVLLL